MAAIGEARQAQLVDLGNQFALLYNEWVNIQRVPGTINAHEILLWKDIREAWKVLDHAVHYE